MNRPKWEKMQKWELNPFSYHLPIKEGLFKISQNFSENVDMGFQKIRYDSCRPWNVSKIEEMGLFLV